MHRWLMIGLLLGLLTLLPARAIDAQDVADDLQVEDIALIARVDAFGQEVPLVSGRLLNVGDVAYTGINLFADALNADGEPIGEAFGFIVDGCGVALTDFALQPGDSRRFELKLELYEDGDITDYEVFPQAQPIEPEPADDPDRYTGLTLVSEESVVAVQWADDASSLNYGVGCDELVFTTYDWYRYDLAAGESETLEEAPNLETITEAMLRQTGINQVTQSRLDDPQLFFRSYLTFPTQSRRIIWQTDLHTLVTSERDGSFKRVVYNNLYQYSLQGFNFSPAGNFVAYYFGAYGEPVRYLTGSMSGSLIGATLQNNDTSQTVPGLTDDAQRVIVGATYPDADSDPVSGYYLKSVLGPSYELLFATDELPGNNYPAPAYWRKDADTRYIYLIRDVDGETVLQCYHREGETLHTLTPLPLSLRDDERAWSWLAPDAATLAIAATGRHDGLWLVDLDAFDVCR